MSSCHIVCMFHSAIGILHSQVKTFCILIQFYDKMSCESEQIMSQIKKLLILWWVFLMENQVYCLVGYSISCPVLHNLEKIHNKSCYCVLRIALRTNCLLFPHFGTSCSYGAPKGTW